MTIDNYSKAIFFDNDRGDAHISYNASCSSRKIEIVELVVTSILQISRQDLHLKQRGIAPIAYARQVAMYLSHISFGISFTQIGRFFGRDRTTVAHACQRIEDDRENLQIEWVLNLMELSIRRLALALQRR